MRRGVIKSGSISLAGAATSFIFVATNTCLPRRKTSFVVSKVCLSRHLLRQTYFCRDKHVFAATKHVFCLDKSMFVATFCCDKLTFVATNTCLPRRNTSFVVSKVCLSRHLLRQTYFCRDKHVYAATKHVFCRDKSMFVATFCCDKLTFVATNTCLPRRNTSFVVSKVCLSRHFAVTNLLLSRQTRVCRDETRLLSCQKYVCPDICCDKLTFVATNTCLPRRNTSFVVSKVCLSRHLLRQTYFCRDKHVFCRNKRNFAATKVLSRRAKDVSRQKTCFVATKMILVAAPASDSMQRCGGE